MIFLPICIEKKVHYVAHFGPSGAVEVILNASKCSYFCIFSSTGTNVQMSSRGYLGQYPYYISEL